MEAGYPRKIGNLRLLPMVSKIRRLPRTNHIKNHEILVFGKGNPSNQLFTGFIRLLLTSGTLKDKIIDI